MSLTSTVQELFGKYSVTGVLRERLEFEVSKAADAAAKFSVLSQDMVALREENARLKSELQTVQSQCDQLRNQIDALNPLGPATELDAGAEITLAALANRPAGISAQDISSNGFSVLDIMVWIDEFRSHGFVEVADNDSEFRLTPIGRKYARDYLANHP